ncbi:Isochorismatase hydrolase [Nostocoides australiense Ben110]|uniref:Isochorismatase hydrolase n=1 Tax=Nostocoides australiense Ben110 TaxID=1193182 RepID=W6JZD1_9MICO|nr:isochorismatase family protein [Tetrasphaera australiensis]CCH74933.1 Isochorismatase hydrolase [Tetrasphaera australiensis Ben110]
MSRNVSVRSDIALVAIDLMERVVMAPARPHSGLDVVTRTIVLAEALRAKGGHVVWVRSERPTPTQPPGSDLVPLARPQPEDLIVVKRTWGAFTATGLHERLQARGVTTLWLTGIATSNGVESTGRAADELGYRLVFVEDAMTAPVEGEHEHSVSVIFPRLGNVVRHSQLIGD